MIPSASEMWCWKTPQMASWNGINIVHEVRRPIMTKLFFGSHWMRIFPRWVMLSEGHLEHSFWLPPWAPTAGHSLFLPGSAPTHSVTPCTCQAPQKGSDVSTYQTIFSLSQKNVHLLAAISMKREDKNH